MQWNLFLDILNATEHQKPLRCRLFWEPTYQKMNRYPCHLLPLTVACEPGDAALRRSCLESLDSKRFTFVQAMPRVVLDLKSSPHRSAGKLRAARVEAPSNRRSTAVSPIDELLSWVVSRTDQTHFQKNLF